MEGKQVKRGGELGGRGWWRDSSSQKKTPWAVHHIIGAGKSLHCIEAKKILITVNVGVIRMWRCKSN